MIDPSGFNELKLCRSGPMLFNKNDWPIGQSLRVYGEYCWHEVEVFKKLVKPGDLVVDAGANIGTHTVELSRMAAVVLAFEPQRISFQTLCANVALNHCINVHAFNVALGSKRDMIKVPVRDQYKPNNFGGVQLAGVTDGEPVEQRTLDSFGLLSCDFIKADVEGMEADLLKGARNTIHHFRPILYLEADGAQYEEALRLVSDWGYDCYSSTPHLYNAENFAHDAENIYLIDGNQIASINMLCLPAERNIEVRWMDRIASPEVETV